MTWRGELGQFEAVAPSEPRPQRRRAIAARELLLRLRDELARAEGARRDELERAIADAAVGDHEARSAELASAHAQALPTIDWRAVAAVPPPLLPPVDQARSHEARRRLLDYRPDPFGLVDRRRTLQADVERLIAEEEEERSAGMGQWRVQMSGWSAWCSLSARVLCNDVDAYREAVDASGTLDEIHDVLGRSAIEIELRPDNAIVALAVKRATIEELLARGSDVAREYLCGAPLRIARELFAVLPIGGVTLARVEQPAIELARAAVDAITWDRIAASAAFDRLCAG